ncbi:unnamed protein product, partial [Mesorhabditis spiculigera]
MKAKWLLKAKLKLQKLRIRLQTRPQNASTSKLPLLPSDVLAEIFRRLPLRDRARARQASHGFRRLVDELPIRLPFLMFHTDTHGNVELLCDQLDFLTGRLLARFSGRYEHLEDALLMDTATAEEVLRIIAAHVSTIAHLWLDCKQNGEMAKILVEANVGRENVAHRISIEQLTVIGNTGSDDFDWYRKLVLLSRKDAKALRFRHVRIASDEQAHAFWQAVGQCHKLELLQYEPCRTDHLSREYIVEALETKPIKNLTITNIDNLSPSDLSMIGAKGRLRELSVVADSIKPEVLTQKCLHKTVASLNTLLIQVEADFSIDNTSDREAIFALLRLLPITATLEVVHVPVSTSHAHTSTGNLAARIIGFWLALAMEAERTIKLKIDGLGQELTDAGAGRVLRKCHEVTRGPYTPDGLWLQSGLGSLLVLDRHTWFGDEDFELC